MAELVVVDRALVQALLLAVLATQALRRRDPAALAVVVLTGLGAAAALGLNQLAGQLYFRPRPYWALPTIHAIGGRAGDSSFFSDHTTIAAAAATGCLLLSRRWGLAAASATVLVALGRVTIGAHYPSDVAIAVLVGPAPSPPCSPYDPAPNASSVACSGSTRPPFRPTATSSAVSTG